MSENGFLLYPLDTGEDPVCLFCGKTMIVAGVETRDGSPEFIAFKCEKCAHTEKFICEEPSSSGSSPGSGRGA
jgi:tRNA(Ile2) C34 agmatinyltransferase TiaS